MSKVTILPNLRKGLSNKIVEGLRDPENTRAGFHVEAKLQGHRAGSDGSSLSDLSEEETLKHAFYLAGPVDVMDIPSSCIYQCVPADKAGGFGAGYLPYLEFHDEDLPWRYTPLPPSENLVPWIMLLACKEGEYALESDEHGRKRVKIDLGGLSEADRAAFYPDSSRFHRLAHAQVTTPGDEQPLDYVKKHPFDGVSRLFCSRPLDPWTEYTVFLVPAFELGRLAGLGESFSGNVGLTKFSWEGNPVSTVFPVYYQWSFTTGGDTFMTLARKQKFLTAAEAAALPSGLKADISETGLKRYRLPEVTPLVNDAEPIDIPGALVKKGLSEKALSTEDPRMEEELKVDLLKKSPVFSDDGEGSFPLHEDPWVVPPVYGARHILAKPEALDRDDLFLKDLNLKFRNRAVAGMGANVVKKNQEMFMNRAWGMVEEVNRLNQRVKEFYEVYKTNGAAAAKISPLREYVFKAPVYGLQTDAAIRIANAQSAAKVNQLDLATDVTRQKAEERLNVMYSSMGDYTRQAGMTLDELRMIENETNIAERKASIIAGSHLYKMLNGAFDFYSLVPWKYRFLKSLYGAVYPQVGILTRQTDNMVWYLIKSRSEASMVALVNWILLKPKVVDYVPQPFGTLYAEEAWAWLADGDAITVLDDYDLLRLQPLVRALEHAKTVFDGVWGVTGSQIDGEMEELTLPVGTRMPVWDEKYPLSFLKQKAYDARFKDDPEGIGIALRNRTHIILPEKRFYDGSLSRAFVFKYSPPNLALVKCLDLALVAPSNDERNENDNVFWPRNEGKLVRPIGCGHVTIHKALSRYEEGGRYKILKWLVDQFDSFPTGLYKMKCENLADKIYTWVLAPNPKVTLLRSNDLLCLVADDSSDLVEIEWESNLIWAEGDSTYVQMDRLKNYICRAFNSLVWFMDHAWRPDRLDIITERDKDPFEGIRVVTPDEMLGLNRNTVEGELDKVFDAFRMQIVDLKLNRAVNMVTGFVTTNEPEASKKSDIVLAQADADQINRKRLVAIAKDFAKKGMTLDLMESNFDGKHPVMAAPVFPDPTSFYLRELSERFLLPSVEELKMNSISCFQSNLAFEEAFLAGMNTEMGRELLWREYPTDERGSYFRKFWDQDELPEDFGKGYFDVKYMHNWQGRLGENHEDGKEPMLVFVVKSELMANYPDTLVRLAKAETDEDGAAFLNPVLSPVMTGWLSNDTFMAGFQPGKLPTTKGVYLAFMETDKSQRFNYSFGGTSRDESSSDFASNRAVAGSVWGVEINPDFLKL